MKEAILNFPQGYLAQVQVLIYLRVSQGTPPETNNLLFPFVCIKKINWRSRGC